ncbi:hypothetical protein [Rossellomorea sp. SC111]|uniref:hypothetical protein n=1 Tax=Rossellomorea sp. SC111 TaxID=2968985 RepID=UPI00215A2753|nr:hypothetical protein [Rossellomorea sp. SC111]
MDAGLPRDVLLRGTDLGKPAIFEGCDQQNPRCYGISQDEVSLKTPKNEGPSL